MELYFFSTFIGWPCTNLSEKKNYFSLESEYFKTATLPSSLQPAQMTPPGGVHRTPAWLHTTALILIKLYTGGPRCSPGSSAVCVRIRHPQHANCPRGYAKQSFALNDFKIQIFGIRQMAIGMMEWFADYFSGRIGQCRYLLCYAACSVGSRIFQQWLLLRHLIRLHSPSGI